MPSEQSLAQSPVRVTSQELQGLFDEQTYRLARSDARAGAVGELRIEGERVRAAVQGNRPRPFELWVRRDGDRIVSQCNCPDWAGARRHCRHVAAVLYTLIDSLQEAPAQPARQAIASFSSWLSGDLPHRVPLRLFYVLEFQGDRLGVHRRRQDQGTEIHEGDLERLSAEDQRVAEVLSSLERSGGGFWTPLTRGGDVLAALEGRAVYLDDRQQLPLVFSSVPMGLRITGSRAEAGQPIRFCAALWLRGEDRVFDPRRVQLLGGLTRFAIADDIAYPLDARLPFAALARFREHVEVEAEPSVLGRALSEWLPRLSEELGAAVPAPEEIIPVHSDAPEVSLASEGDLLNVTARLYATYGQGASPIEISGPEARPAGLEVRFDSEGKPYGVRRDLAAEQEAVGLLARAGLRPTDGGHRAEGPEALAFWSRGVHLLPQSWRLQLPAALVGLRVRNDSVRPVLRVRRAANGWFDVDLRLLSDGVEVDGSQLDADLWGDFVTLRDGSVAPVDGEIVDPVLAAFSDVRGLLPRGSGQLPPWLSGSLAALVASVGAGATVDSEARRVLDGLQGDPPELEALPEGLAAELRPYQTVGYRWLCFLRDAGQGQMGALLADEMGLGKTVQALAFLLRERLRRGREGGPPTLVVTPTSVLPNWLREAERFTPDLRTEDFSGGDRKLPEAGECDLIVTSYALLRRDAELLAQREFSTVILDEAQNIKNPQSVTARAANELRAEFRIALTGTPVENRPLDLWSIFRFLSPELLGSQTEFEKRYEAPADGQLERAHVRLANRVRPFVRRRLKRDVLSELPDKQELEMVCDLTAPQKKLYLTVLSEVRREVMGAIESQGVGRAQLNILAGLLRLRQIACDPRLLRVPGRESRHPDEDSGKLQLWLELLHEALEGDHRVVCFSQFVEMLKLMRAALDREGIRYEYLDGKTRDRQEIIDRFNKPGPEAAPVFLISLKAGGTGLNLATADTVFIYDPWWNPAVEDQAVDRVHRIGQGREVTVYRLLARGTVEEKILELKRRKREMSARLTAGDSAALPTFTAAEVDELLRAG